MAFRKAPTSLPMRNNARNGGYRVSVIALLVISVIAPLVILATRTTSFRSSASERSSVSTRVEDSRRRSALEGIETLIPKEVLDIVNPASEGSEPLNLNVVARKDESSSWVQEEGPIVTRKSKSYQDSRAVSEDGEKSNSENADRSNSENADRSNSENGDKSSSENGDESNRENGESVAEDGAIKQVVQSKDDGAAKSATEVVSSASLWKKDSDTDNSDALVRLMRDQLIMARAYANIAQGQGHYALVRDLKLRIKKHTSIVADANVDAELPASAEDKMKAMSELLAEAREKHYDNSIMVKKLRAMLQSTEDNARMLKKQSTFLSQLAAKTVPKGLHCFSMRLTVEYHMLSPEEQQFEHKLRLEDPSLYHYALFSDNILAAAVVVNSTVSNAQDPEKHVFHIVTDKLNYGAMKMWFLVNPPGDAAIEVQNVDDFKWLNSSYCPVLKQLESSSMKDYYFKADQANPLAAGTSNLKYRNPKYLSMLNHLRFYLPEVFPTLDKIVFLDDDIVVQKDLTPLWEIDLNGNVNGAVETCGVTFHRFDKYLNFSNPLISENFDPMACGWAYGMNVFDLKQWKREDITGIYHKWQSLNEERTLWKLGTLPPGLITFYNLTQPLEKWWHVLGLGYNPAIEESEIETAAVIHWNGNMKPWLEIGMAQFRPYWSKYVKYDHPFLQQCNINE